MVLLSTMLLPGHDRAVLSRLDPDAGDRPATVPGFHPARFSSFYLVAQKELASPKIGGGPFLYMPFL